MISVNGAQQDVDFKMRDHPSIRGSSLYIKGSYLIQRRGLEPDTNFTNPINLCNS